MSKEDLTPLPTSVEVETDQKSADSTRSFAVDVAQTGQEKQVHLSRGLVKALLISTIAVAGVVGPNAGYAVVDSIQADNRAEMAKAEAEPAPTSLQFAQLTAADKLFGVKGGENSVDAAKKIANRPAVVEHLNVNSYVDPTHVQIGKEGRFFTVEGKDYELARSKTENGDVYVLAGKRFIESGILKDRDRLVGAMLVGGARNDATSDINKDGVVTPEEVRMSADLSAQHNLKRALQPPKRFVVGRVAQNEK